MNTAAKSGTRGCRPSAKTRAKMSAAHLGKKRPSRSEEWRRILSEARKGKELGPRNRFGRGGTINWERFWRDYKEEYFWVFGLSCPMSHPTVRKHHRLFQRVIERYLRPMKRVN